MTGSAPRYDRWKAPTEDGQPLIWPESVALLRDTLENHRLLSSADSVHLQNVPLHEVRRRLRQWIGHTEDERPIISTGHQAELHHPGVWVKNVLIDTLAGKLQGRAIHIAVDTDEPKHLLLRWPGGSVPLSDDQEHARAAWSGLLRTPTPAHLQQVTNLFETAAQGWSFDPLAPKFLTSMRRLSLESVSLPNALTNSLHELDWSLGLRYDALLASPICLAEPYLVFVHHVLSRADEFASDYNAALAEFRIANKIRTPGRPMPDLRISNDRIEVPFWLDNLRAESRTRASVVRDQGAFALRLEEGEQFIFHRNADGWTAASELMLWMRRQGVRLAPRALTLTAVLRLLLADQFVHGIGGGQYDQVLDKLIARHFHFEPPRFSVTTATLYFPEAVGQPRVCLPCLAQEGRRLKHNLLEGKMQIVQAIASQPRRSLERSRLFYQMHDKLDAVATSHPAVRGWEQQYEQAQRRSQQERVLFDRELFYAIQPASRLSEMIERYRGAFATT